MARRIPTKIPSRGKPERTRSAKQTWSFLQTGFGVPHPRETRETGEARKEAGPDVVMVELELLGTGNRAFGVTQIGLPQQPRSHLRPAG